MARAGEPLLRSRHRAAQMSAGGRDGVEAFVIAKQHKVLFRKRSFAASRKLLRRAELEAAHWSGQYRGAGQPQDSGRCRAQGREEASQCRETQEAAPTDGGWI